MTSVDRDSSADFPERDTGGTKPRIGGAISALLTPFKNSVIDEASLRFLVEWHISQGIAGISPCGIAGEGSTLSAEERAQVIRTWVETSNGRESVVAATGTNNTDTTISLTKAAESLGADAALVTVPYYTKPTQDGILRHFEAVAGSVNIPLIVYNSPAHTGMDLHPLTVTRLAAFPSIVGMADATGDTSRLASNQAIASQLTHLSGHDSTAFAFRITGGAGVISALANVLPALTVALHEACDKNNIRGALSLHDELLPLIHVFGREDNPAAIKYALHLLFGISPDVRLPLVPIPSETMNAIRVALEPFTDGDHDQFFGGCRLRV